MSGLTSFPHSHGGGLNATTQARSSISFEHRSKDEYSEQGLQEVVELAYATLIFRYTGESIVRFLTLDLCGDRESWLVKRMNTTQSEGQSNAGHLLQDETISLQRDNLEAPNVLIRVSDCTSEVSDGPENGVVFRLVYSSQNEKILQFRACYSEDTVGEFHAQRMIANFSDCLTLLMKRESISSCSALTQRHWDDDDWIKQWNSTPQQLDDRTIHDCISQVASQSPDKIAIEAHDGRFTRGQLQQQAEAMALRLLQADVVPNGVIAIVMDKSQWVIVTILAVLKVGAAFLLLDPSLPLERLKVMTEKVHASHTVTTPDHSSLAVKLTKNILVHIGKGNLLANDQSAEASMITSRLPHVSPKDIAFYIFTSGSSGIPKAIATQHFAWCTGYTHHAHKIGIQEGTRVFQYASYSFVVSILDMISTLLVGGIVCIPGTYERANDLDGAIRRFAPDYLCVTPSVAKLLEPENFSSLKTLSLVGEPIPNALVQKWLGATQTRLLNGYGQSEACSMNSVAELTRDPRSHSSIGRSTWLRYWVVDPSDHDRLMPIGAVGELVVEGRSIALGYHDEPEKTAKAFIKMPRWSDGFEIPKDHRWYKTGDLVQWQADGTLMLFGRNDAQVKFHGMRVQMGEIEHHVSHAFREEVAEVVVEKVRTPQEEGDRELLVAFIVARDKQKVNGHVEDKNQDLKHRHELEVFLRDQMKARLAEQLPLWMTPTEVVVINAMPRTPTGKLHRSTLRDSYPVRDRDPALTTSQIETKEPVNMKEITTDPGLDKMRSLWAKVGHIKENQIEASSRWAEIGGDSLSAIALVREARKAGFELSTAKIMSGLTLLDASHQRRQNHLEPEEHPDQKHLRHQGDVKLYPLTDFQVAYSPTAEHKFRVWEYRISLRGDFGLDRLRTALESLIRGTESLRTSIVEDATGTLKQKILPVESEVWKGRIREGSNTSGHNFLTTPVLFLMPDQVDASARELTFSIHIGHIIFDGISWDLILKDIASAYAHDGVISTRPSFTGYLQSRLLQRSPDSYEYWRNLLQGSSPSPCIPLKSPSARPDPNNIEPFSNEHIFDRILNISSDETQLHFPASVVCQVAWAITLNCVTRHPDVIFGYLFHGRDENITESEQIIGCCTTIVPARIQLDETMTSVSLLDHVQKQVHSSSTHSHLGSHTIAQSCTDWPRSEEWYYHRFALLHQNVPEPVSLPVGDLGYMHIKNVTTNRRYPSEFHITTVAAGSNILLFKLRIRKDLYRHEDGSAVADAFSLAAKMVVAGTSTVGQIRDALLTKHPIPRMWVEPSISH